MHRQQWRSIRIAFPQMVLPWCEFVQAVKRVNFLPSATVASPSSRTNVQYGVQVPGRHSGPKPCQQLSADPAAQQEPAERDLAPHEERRGRHKPTATAAGKSTAAHSDPARAAVPHPEQHTERAAARPAQDAVRVGRRTDRCQFIQSFCQGRAKRPPEQTNLLRRRLLTKCSPADQPRPSCPTRCSRGCISSNPWDVMPPEPAVVRHLEPQLTSLECCAFVPFFSFIFRERINFLQESSFACYVQISQLLTKKKYKNTKIQKYKNTKIQKYKNTKIHKYKNTKIQKYKNTKIQKYKNTKIQKYKNTKIQKYKNTKIQKYKNTKIQKYKNTKIQKYKNTKIQKYKNTKIQKHKNTKVQKYKNVKKHKHKETTPQKY
ncbi:uncharacterized protein LOC128092435 isoform X1 [Culex pipiens pallens]|uniref:uncharacterized protein LOC128092435 isoform X1 n=1 Tax=Culex pipiens pallens TaxID=42434 RepID=UPI0022AA8A96|nr:uncharacterized protein LOC128092435 isoform X1 [Culex pipiens pallens]